MSKISTLNEIHDEPTEPWPARRHSPHRPKLSYHQAMSQYMVSSSGQVTTVRDILSVEFAEMVIVAIATATDPEACAKELHGLNFFERVDRWYALCELARYGATLPVFDDRAAAESSVISTISTHPGVHNERKSDILDTLNAREIERNPDTPDTLMRVGMVSDERIGA